ncbi:MAG TPA: hypothetical protein PKV73_05360 [Agriterribacter sp.]|nr:hypothetical protein [Agriterribacter sp.]
MHKSKLVEGNAEGAPAAKFDCPERQHALSKFGKGFTATTYDSGFSLSHDTYNGIFCASDGKIYYVLCSISKDEGGRMYCFDPASKEITFCGDLTEICGEKGLKAIPQGKSHVTFVESDGKLFFATHIGYYDLIDGRDMKGAPPEGYKPYPGGHLLSYDLKEKTFTDYGVAPANEGVLTMNMDTRRGIVYGITWPKGHFFRYNIQQRAMTDFGTISKDGEDGKGDRFRVLCRSIAIDPHDGAAYFSTSEGDIFKCESDAASLVLVGKETLRKDYFGHYDPASPGHMGYNWRQVFWHEPDKLFYGIHGNSGYLFSFDPRSCSVELLQRITSVPSRKTGMFDQFSYGYLGFVLGHDEQTIYYLTGAPIFENGKMVLGKKATGKGEAKGLEHLHCITYNLTTRRYCDHGPVFFKNGQSPLYVNSITIGLDGTVYFLGRITENGTTRTDLISIGATGND